MALVVEDGTGLAAADSYESIADTETRLNNLGLTSFSSLSTDAAKEGVIRLSTVDVDNYLEGFVEGTKRDNTQARLFPRYNCFNKDNIMFANSEIPEEVKYAVAFRCEDIASGLPPDIMNGIREWSTRDLRVVFQDSEQTTYRGFKSESKRAARQLRNLRFVG